MESANGAPRTFPTTRRWALVGLLALLVGLAVVLAVRSLRGSRGAASTLASEARTVVVAEDGPEPYVSAVHLVRSGQHGPRVIRTFDALGAPDVELSPDGARLYVVSGDRRPGDELVVFHAATGEVLRAVRLQPERRLFRVSAWPSPCCLDTMEVSPDGRWLFILWLTPGDQGERTYFIATFDAKAGRMLPDMMPLEDCDRGIRALVPLPGARRLAVVCEETTDLRILEASRTGDLSAAARLELPPVHDIRSFPGGSYNFGRVAWAVPTPDRRRLSVVRLNGHVTVVDLDGRAVLAEYRLRLGPEWHIGYGQVRLSGDSESMYVGLGPMSDGFNLTTGNQVMRIDTSTWSEDRVVPTGTPFGTFAVTPTGDVYVSSEPRGVLLLDMESGLRSDVAGLGGPGPEMLDVAG